MVSKCNTIVASSLTEDDIPGAKLETDPLSATVLQLKRWLACRRGASTSGVKSELVQRVSDYISGGLSETLLIDPENTQHAVDRERGKTVSAVTCTPTGFHQPPKEGWTRDLSQLRLHFPKLGNPNSAFE